jgi:peptide/nickel transport system permease protein
VSLAYLGRRVLQLVPAVLGVLIVGFLLIELAPGDPVIALAGEAGDAAYYEFMREKFGLDRPLPERFATFLSNLVRGDLGVSYTRNQPAMRVVLQRVPATLLLAATALAISSVAGILVGVLTSKRAGRFSDLAINTGMLTVFAAPVFWVGQLMLLAFGVHLGWFPVHGMASPGSAATGLSRVADVAHHLALPALALASQEIAATARLTRTGMITQLRRDHVRTARAKGCPEGRVMFVHGLRSALLPVVTLIGGRVGHLLAGAVVVEAVFSWPGIGRLLLSAMQTRDTPILLSIFLLVGITVVLANLLTDLAYRALDPRITLERV